MQTKLLEGNLKFPFLQVKNHQISVTAYGSASYFGRTLCYGDVTLTHGTMNLRRAVFKDRPVCVHACVCTRVCACV